LQLHLVFSSKKLGAFGEGGAIVTNSKEISDLVLKISDHGQLGEKHRHFMIGRNSRLDSIQASILSAKLKHLDQWNNQRRKVASFYLSNLAGHTEFIFPFHEEHKKHVYHLFVIRCKERAKLIELLDEKLISWGIHYPKALPFTDPYNYKKHTPDDFIEASSIIPEILSIPIYPELTEEQLIIICEQLKKYHE
jgi:dTDP-4-amino-4,6-dideoxygalactose transaminase